MEGFFFFAIVGIGVAVVVAGATAKRRQAINAAWGDAATRLRLMFKPSDLVTSPRITGAIDGCSVTVTTFTRNTDKARCIRYRIEYRTPHREKIEIRERGRFADLRRIFGGDFVEFGDAEFDGKLEVHAPDTDGTRAFLNPLRRRRLLDLYRDFPGTVIETHRLTWESKQIPTEPRTLVRAVEKLSAAALDLSPGADSRTAEAAESRPSSRRLPRQAPERPRPERAPPPKAPTATPRAPTPPAPVKPAPRPAAPAPQPAPQSAPGEAPPPPTEPPASAGPSCAGVATAMFASMAATMDIEQRFAREFRDQTVRWSGELTSVSRYPFDRVFGGTPGTRAVFHICDVETSLGRRPVQAVVQLPEDAVGSMRAEVGAAYVFEGTLAVCDGFMRTLYLTAGRVVSHTPIPTNHRPG